MKKTFTLLVCIATSLAALADRPILVGHRGSLYGVENSVESFTNGAKMGYDYLETDFKVTKDKQFVCSHDDDISRLSSDGSSASIANSTLEELQSHPFRQTRSGVTYEGRLCSGQEYLDVCKEYGVRPLIELKWATGINSNDCSNIPLLIKFIEDNGFRDKCIILTSMKPCLEYIRTNYPDIELQFLTGQYWANHFDWCVDWEIDADIEAGYFDKSTVTKYHDKGLKVNMWTTNTNDGYKQYGNWGCDFITTDYLDPKSLPELDPSATFPPNTVDYPNSDGAVSSRYETEVVNEASSPSNLEGRTVTKVLFDGGEWVVLSFDAAGANPTIDRIDPFTGKVTGSYNTAGVENLGDIAMTADGVLIASNCTAVTHMGVEGAVETGTFRLYKWDNAGSNAEEFFSTNTAADLGNWNNSLAGKHIAVSGRYNDLKVYVSTWSTAGNTSRPAGFHFEKGTLTGKGYDLSGSWGTDYTMTVTPTSRDCFIVNSASMAPVEYTFIWGDRATLEENGGFPAGVIEDDAEGISFHRRASKVYSVLPDTAGDGTGYTAKVYDATDGIGTVTEVTDWVHPGVGGAEPGSQSVAPGYTATAMSDGADGNMYVHLFTQNAGLASVRLFVAGENAEVREVDLELTRDWIYSNTTDNHPGHIDGTNAQQGTAVNGYFYINNCDEKKLHIFNESGYLGSIPGGAGWGCARDDAGNIVIRNDKQTGNTHSFLVYAAGATPDNYQEAVAFDADVVYDGQTNFINAGGDLLNGTGHIYLYPNGQTSVNIITVTNGAVTASKGYVDLAIAGSTAGYVIPVNDDTENWIYQVRTVGMYFYNGGINNDLSTTRPSTEQPARNSTGGGAYFKMMGNTILVHNSGANYKGGFTVRNLSENKVVANVQPIGTLGYETGGNYSTFNWLVAEKVSDGQYTLYQYCPSNGIAKYTLKDRLNEVRDITVADSEAAFNVYADHNTVSVSGIDVNTLRVYNMAGVLVATSDSDSADISALTPGVYIVTVNNASSAKFVKK